MSAQGPRIVLLGKQGAGKGTQGDMLAAHYGVEHLSTGDLFRVAAALGTDGGLEAKRYMDAGELVPDATVIKVVDQHFTGDFLERGFILDGFPRTLPQAEELERVLGDAHPLDIVLNLEIPTEIVLDRIAGRRVCENGHTYHVNTPPKLNWTCDACGGKVVQRDDDTEEAIQRRLELYEAETVPIINFYDRLGKVVVVDAVGEGDDVFERLVKEIDQRFEPNGS